jgi:hypothetical protein
MRRSHLLVAGLLLAGTLSAQQSTFSDVKARFAKSNEREMEEEGAALILDDANRRLRVKSGDRPLDISYDDVTKVVIEVDTLGRKAGFGASFIGMMAGGVLFQNAIATSIDKPFDNDHYVVLEYKHAGGQAAYGLIIEKNAVPAVLKALQGAVGERLHVPVFDEKTLEVGKDTLPKTRFKYLNTDKKHPLPEVRPDKALVVVVSPATVMRRIGPEKKYGYAALFANKVPVGLTGPGCYLFFYLDPGDYELISQTYDAVGLRMKLEAGKDYYLTQTLYAKGIRPRSFLTRHSKELVMYEVAGSLWSEWSLDDKE